MKKHSVFNDIYNLRYTDANEAKARLYASTRSSKDFVQRFGLLKSLSVHKGCVNTISWNENGEYLLSGSDDQQLVITNGHNYKVQMHYKTAHRANIFSAKFLPCSSSSKIVSCSGDGSVIYTELLYNDRLCNLFNCHNGTTYEVITLPKDPNSFMSCGEDGTVRYYDLRIKCACSKSRCTEDIMIQCSQPITALAVNEKYTNQIAVGGSDNIVRTFDRRMLSTIAMGRADSKHVLRPVCIFKLPTREKRFYRITSLCYSPDGNDILVSYSSESLYLFSVNGSGTDFKLNTVVPVPEPSNRRSNMMPPLRRLRLRGDWSDTGPDARPEREGIGQARPQLQTSIMQRMTNVLSRMLNDPATRAALSAGGEDMLSDEPRVINRVINRAGEHVDDFMDSENQNDIEPTSEEQSEERSLRRTEDGSNSQSQGSANHVSVTHTSTYPIGAPTGKSSTDLGESSRNVNNSDFINTTGTTFNNSLNYETATAIINTDDNNGAVDEGSRSIVNNNLNYDTATAVFQNDNQNTPDVVAALPDLSQATISDISLKNGVPNDTKPADLSVNSATDPLVTNESMEYVKTFSATASSSSSGVCKQVRTKIAEVASTSSMRPLGHNNVTNSESFPTNGPADQQYVAEERTATQQRTAAQEGAAAARDLLAEADNVVEPEQPIPIVPLFDMLNDAGLPTSNLFPDVHEIYEHHSVNRGRRVDWFDYSNTTEANVGRKFTGHRNTRTMIKEANFYGNDYVMSGSDCGHVFIWDRHSGNLVKLLQADHHVVNCVQPHPSLPLLATSGIDYDVKLWAPVAEHAEFDEESVNALIVRNGLMMEETRDTITVPAAFMIRMLACVHSLRRGNRQPRRRRDNEEENN